MDGISEDMSFGARWKLAWRVLFDAPFARRLMEAGKAQGVSSEAGAPSAGPRTQAVPAVPTVTPERMHASGLQVLAALQREGRLVDFLQQEVTGFSDEDVASAARVVHAGCRRVLQQGLELEPAITEPEGATISVPPGFDAQRIRLIGNIAGQPPFRGTVRHAGWVVRTLRFPAVSESLDPRILAAAEVELP